MKAFIIALVASLAAAVPTGLVEKDNTSAQVIPSSVTVRSITYGGTGCGQGTLNITVQKNGQVLGLDFSDMVALIGPNVDVTNNRKDCQINFDLLYPAGFQYQVLSSDFHGYAYLDSGVTGTVQSTYYYSGSTDQVCSLSSVVRIRILKMLTRLQDVQSATITGPVNAHYTKHDDEGILIWSPCGTEAMLNVKSSVALTGSGSGALTQDKTSAKFTTYVNLRWQQC
jgi:hypothetical protein